MDISRWGVGRLARISEGYRNVRDFFEDVLEGERSFVLDGSGEFVFERKNPAAIFSESTVAPRATSLNIMQCLVPCFEAGFLIKKRSKSTVTVESMFLLGRMFTPPATERTEIRVRMPDLSDDRVYRGRVRAVLKTFGLVELRSLNQASTFAISLTGNSTLILICDRPHPWQWPALEDAFRFIRSAYPVRKRSMGRSSGSSQPKRGVANG